MSLSSGGYGTLDQIIGQFTVNNLTVKGTATISLTDTLLGNLILGNATTDGGYIAWYKSGTQYNALQVTAASTLSILSGITSVVPNTDSSISLATASLRWSSVSSIAFNTYHTLGDANPSSQLGDGFIKFGVGGATALQESIFKTSSLTGALNAIVYQTLRTNGYSLLGVAPSGTSTSGQFYAFRTSDYTTNYEVLIIGGDVVNSNELSFQMLKGGTGSLRPIIFYMSTTESFRILPTTPVGGIQLSTFLVLTGSGSPIAASSEIHSDSTGGNITIQVPTGKAIYLDVNAIEAIHVGSTGIVINATANTNIWTSSQGSASATLYIGDSSINVTPPSWSSLKENIIPAEYALSVIDKFHIMSYDYHEGQEIRSRGRWNYGWLYEEVYNIPEVRYAITSDGYFEGHNLVPLLIRAIQEQQKQIEELRIKI